MAQVFEKRRQMAAVFTNPRHESGDLPVIDAGRSLSDSVLGIVEASRLETGVRDGEFEAIVLDHQDGGGEEAVQLPDSGDDLGHHH
ncbi:hypothetical protein [Nocardiopsis sp. L17-MgMaSL7]|uniref:hypothetical protein n=1 Tax=Nocardiopsis sp. L17-MgMaSL7 TaxID=1938893 RepID=UPI0018F689C5|nr:hypothetical protein [Nocardiopsis sp. L17-MgMaSL7]